MAELLRVPPIGVGATSGTLLVWRKQVGESVAPGDVV